MHKSSFDVQDVTPAILDIIRAHSPKSGLISHDQLVLALLDSPQGAALVGAAAATLGLSEKATAAIVIAQFSKQYTDTKPLPDDIRREQYKSKWAYGTTVKKSSPFFPFDLMMKAMDEEVAEYDASLSDRRQAAVARLRQGHDFLIVAEESHVSARVLLAWQKHENGKWINDPHEGREPGPSDDYDGEWPDENEELEAYAAMGIDVNQFTDLKLRARYASFLSAIRHKSGPIPPSDA